MTQVTQICRCCRQYRNGGLEFASVRSQGLNAWTWNRFGLGKCYCCSGRRFYSAFHVDTPHQRYVHVFRALGLHGTLEIDKERDWTAKCPCPAWTWHEKRATENGSVPICSCIYSHSHFLVLCFDSFFFSFFSVSAQNASPHSDVLFRHEFQISPGHLVYSFSLAKLLFSDLFWGFQIYFWCNNTVSIQQPVAVVVWKSEITPAT